MTPSTPPGRGAENSGPHQGRRLSGCGESPPLRHPGWRQWPLRGGRQGAERSAGTDRSENLDVESKFKEYKETLQAETGESGKADRQIVLAMLTMLEVTNNPVVAERLGFTSSAIGSGYSTSLAKVMDVIIHTPGTASVALKGGKGYTRDVAKLMGAYADSLENVAAALADIQDPDYSATYGDDDTVTLNLDGAKALRASAMAMASALNIAASYQYGPDSAYVTQQEEVTLPRMHIKDTWGMQPTTTYEESSSTLRPSSVSRKSSRMRWWRTPISSV
jgi:hypothetical protein